MTPTPTATPDELDFALIRSRYPCAFAALIAYALNQSYEATAPMVAKAPDSILWHSYHRFAYHPRELYDFFDQQGVYVSVEARTTRRTPLRFSVILITKGPTINDFVGYFNDRSAAETAAFWAAFAKLEEMLTT